MASTRTGDPSLKARRLTTLADIGTNVTFGCHNNDLNTARRALLERVFFVQVKGEFQLTPVPEAGHLMNALGPLAIEIASLVGNCHPITREAFADSYKGRKAKVYKQAVAELNLKGLKESDSYLTSFVKAEKINLSDKPDPAPRIIQPRGVKFNVEVGRYLKPIEHKVYAAINSLFGEDVVCKGLNADERGKLAAQKWAQFSNPVAVSLDASRFDQHVSPDALSVEHLLYQTIYRKDKKLRDLLALQITNKGFVNCPDGRIKYSIRGGRCSGDMNTAMGNVALMCFMVYHYMSPKNIKYSFLDDGDDCVIILEKGDLSLLDDLVAQFLRFGFQMKRENVAFVLEHLTFCQCRPVRVGGSYRMVRDPRSCLAKDLLHTQQIRQERDWKIRRAAISSCGLALAGDIPIFNEFYHKLGEGCHLPRAYVNYDVTGMDMLARGMHKKYSVPTDETRYSFYLAFGLTPDFQTAMEEFYRGVNLKWVPIHEQSSPIVAPLEGIWNSPC